MPSKVFLRHMDRSHRISLLKEAKIPFRAGRGFLQLHRDLTWAQRSQVQDDEQREHTHQVDRDRLQ